MKILLISDTHTNTDAAVRIIRDEGDIDLFFHMGDTFQDALRIREETGLPMRAVSGNMDGLRVGPEVEAFELAGVRFLLTHGDRYNVNHGLDRLDALAAEAGADLVCFGHTHRPCDLSLNGRRFLNPGALKGTDGSYGILKIQKDGAVIFDLRRFS